MKNAIKLLHETLSVDISSNWDGMSKNKFQELLSLFRHERQEIVTNGGADNTVEQSLMIKLEEGNKRKTRVMDFTFYAYYNNTSL